MQGTNRGETHVADSLTNSALLSDNKSEDVPLFHRELKGKHSYVSE